MTRYVAFLRGINVSGQRLIRMEDLRSYFMMPGIANIATYIQSGNILFDAKEKDESKLRARIEKQLLGKCSFEVTAVVRSLSDMGGVIQRNPFPAGEQPGEKRLYVSFLEALPVVEKIQQLEGFSNSNEEIRIIGREGYLFTNGYADTRFSNNFIEKKLGMSATTRNWATVNKVIGM